MLIAIKTFENWHKSKTGWCWINLIIVLDISLGKNALVCTLTLRYLNCTNTFMNIWDFNEEIIEQKTGQLLAAGAYFQEIAGKMETWRVHMNYIPTSTHKENVIPTVSTNWLWKSIKWDPCARKTTTTKMFHLRIFNCIALIKLYFHNLLSPEIQHLI